jgi:hypothetical protein
MGTSNQTLKQKAVHETKEFLLIALYLWAVFALMLLHKSVILAEHNIVDVWSQGFAIINALALAKIMLIARYFRLGELGGNRPLLYPTLFKSGVYSLLLAFFKILEEAAVGLYHGQSFSKSIEDLAGGTWKGILSLTAIVFVFLIPFFAFGEVGRVLGEGKLTQLFLHRPEPVNVPEHDTDAVPQSATQAKPGEGSPA